YACGLGNGNVEPQYGLTADATKIALAGERQPPAERRAIQKNRGQNLTGTLRHDEHISDVLQAGDGLVIEQEGLRKHVDGRVGVEREHRWHLAAEDLGLRPGKQGGRVGDRPATHVEIRAAKRGQSCESASLQMYIRAEGSEATPGSASLQIERAAGARHEI